MRWRYRLKLFVGCVALSLLGWVVLNGSLSINVRAVGEGSFLGLADARQTLGATLSLPEVSVSRGGQVVVPLSLVVNDAQIYSADVNIVYDPTVAAALGVARGALAPTWSLASNLETPGLIKVALAGAQPVASGGELLLITLQAVGEGGESTPLTLTRGDLNEGSVTAPLEHGYLWVCSRYDFDCDCDVDVVDIMVVASRWGCGCGDDCYDSLYDLDDDGDIDIVDIMLVASRWGCECGDECYGAASSAISQVEPRPLMGPATVRVAPGNSMVASGETFTMTVEIEDAVDLGRFQLALSFDPAVVQVDKVNLGNFLGSTGRNTAPLGTEVDNDAGTVTFGAFSFGSQPGPSGDGMLAILTLTARGTGSIALALDDVQVVDTWGQAQPVSIEGGRVMAGVSLRTYLPLAVMQ